MWYSINNIDQLDTPALVIFPERVKENIQILKKFVPDLNRVRPHVKTNKCAEVCTLMLDAGINKFKCATIAEAEMLASLGARDILLAYQPAGPKVIRFIELVKKFPSSSFSCLVDNEPSAKFLSDQAIKSGIVLSLFIDLNVGMNRTGIVPEKAEQLFNACLSMKGIVIKGLHAYDGHLRDPDLNVRKAQSDEGFSRVEKLKSALEKKHNASLIVVAGGTPSFPIHATRPNVECSPGTFIFWDKNYQQTLTEQPFLHAALIVTRVVSKPTDGIVTVDLGHKAIASENPLDKRVFFLNAEGLQPIGHSEEHLVLKTDSDSLQVGDVLYGVPYHVCPTVALHETGAVVTDNKFTGSWNIVARKRKISV